DVDLLIEAGEQGRFAGALKQAAMDEGYDFLGSTPFSSLALYFGNKETGAILHVDLFERICWHFLQYVDAAGVFARKRWTGQVYAPAECDEIYMNSMARLIYSGTIREKHRTKAVEFGNSQGQEAVAESFARHLGAGGCGLARNLIESGWQGSRRLRKCAIRIAMRRYGLANPLRLVGGICGYGWRIARKLVSHPGRLLVFEGADGVGKSTVLEEIIPWCSSWCAGRTPYDFHWKPATVRSGERSAAPSVNPRGKSPRGLLASLFYLAYHVAGFWFGWVFRVYPLLVRSHVVVGDRYSYDIYLDPRRFRLTLPLWVCRMAARAVPQPDLTVALIAPAEIIHARKPELTLEEIASYQDRWSILSRGNERMLTVDAAGTPEEVILRVKQAILRKLAR
ncbi:MAG: hypothetical protein WCS43_13350, partial [Verrucomicrobiota bacterium]